MVISQSREICTELWEHFSFVFGEGLWTVHESECNNYVFALYKPTPNHKGQCKSIVLYC